MKKTVKSSHIRASRYVLLFFALNFLISRLLKVFFHAGAYVSMVLAATLPLILVTVLFTQRYGGSIRSYFRLFKLNTSTTLFMVALGICTSAIGSYISIPTRWLVYTFDISMPDSLPTPTTPLGLLWASIFVGVLPAIFEEAFCRGILLREYERYNKTTAVLMSALYFGLLHSSIFNLPYTMFLGVVLALVCINTGSIFACIILHFSANMFSLIWSYAVHNVPEFNYDPRFYGALEVVIACLAILFVLLFISFFINKRKFQTRYFGYGIYRQGIARPPFGFSFCALLVIALSIISGI